MNITTFADERTVDVFKRSNTSKARQIPDDVRSRALVKLDVMSYSSHVDELRVPPGNRLKRLQGDRKEFWSIRINDQWRITFKWNPENKYHEVKIEDYH